jgi:hypothetical protein
MLLLLMWRCLLCQRSSGGQNRQSADFEAHHSPAAMIPEALRAVAAVASKIATSDKAAVARPLGLLFVIPAINLSPPTRDLLPWALHVA